MICITQLLCPQRHCVVASVWDERDSSAALAQEQLREQFQSWVKSGALNPYCGLCRSETLHYESGVTRWQTMEEALPNIREQEREQALFAAAAASHT